MNLPFQCPHCQTTNAFSRSDFSCGKCRHQFKFGKGIYQFADDNNTQTWDTYWKRTPVYDDIMDVLRKIMNIQLRRYLLKSVHPGDCTLEPGGGSAYVSAMLAEKGLYSYALDYAYLPLSIAQKMGSKAVLVQGDIFNLPFPHNTFDLAFNNSTLEHFKNPLDALTEMARVTKPGKYVFVGVPFTYGPLAVYKLKKNSFKGAWDGTTYDRKGLKQLFSEAGLEVLDDRTFFFRCFMGVLGRKKI